MCQTSERHCTNLLTSPSDLFLGYVWFFLWILLLHGDRVVCVGKLLRKLGIKTCISAHTAVVWNKTSVIAGWLSWKKWGIFNGRTKLLHNTFSEAPVLQRVRERFTAKSDEQFPPHQIQGKIIGLVYLLVINPGFREVCHRIKLVFSIVFNSILNHTGEQHHNQRQHSNLSVEDLYLWETVQNHQKEEIKITQSGKI